MKGLLVNFQSITSHIGQSINTLIAMESGNYEWEI